LSVFAEIFCDSFGSRFEDVDLLTFISYLLVGRTSLKLIHIQINVIYYTDILKHFKFYKQLRISNTNLH